MRRYFTGLSAALLLIGLTVILLFYALGIIGELTSIVVGILVVANHLLGAIQKIVSVLSDFLDLWEKWERMKSRSSESIPRKSKENVIQEAEESVGDWVDIWDDGTIKLKPPSTDISVFRKSMLYIFAAMVAYDRGDRETPKVSVDEIAQSGGTYDKQFYLSMEDRDWIAIDQEENEEEWLVELNHYKTEEVTEFIRTG